MTDSFRINDLHVQTQSALIVFEVIKNRRSIRSFRHESIPENYLRIILEAGIWAPSGSNAQPWEFILVREKPIIERIKLFSPGLFGDPDAVVILCINRERVKRGSMSEDLVAVMDIAMAAQNMMLMAYSLGVGSCPINSFNKKAIKELFELPVHIDPILMVSLGYPDKWPKAPKRRPLEEVLHYEKY
mgnify:CR=1 FL=1